MYRERGDLMQRERAASTELRTQLEGLRSSSASLTGQHRAERAASVALCDQLRAERAASARLCDQLQMECNTYQVRCNDLIEAQTLLQAYCKELDAERLALVDTLYRENEPERAKQIVEDLRTKRALRAPTEGEREHSPRSLGRARCATRARTSRG